MSADPERRVTVTVTEKDAETGELLVFEEMEGTHVLAIVARDDGSGRAHVSCSDVRVATMMFNALAGTVLEAILESNPDLPAPLAAAIQEQLLEAQG